MLPTIGSSSDLMAGCVAGIPRAGYGLDASGTSLLLDPEVESIRLVMSEALPQEVAGGGQI